MSWRRPVWALHVLIVGLALHNLVMALLWRAVAAIDRAEVAIAGRHDRLRRRASDVPGNVARFLGREHQAMQGRRECP